MSTTLFHLRYKLAQILIADVVYQSIILQPDFADLKSLDLIQHDKGFFLTSLRLISNLTRLPNGQERDFVKTQILDSKSIYFNKVVLEQSANINLTEKLAEAKTPEERYDVELFDNLVYQKIYDTYFMAFQDDSPSIVHLDDLSSWFNNGYAPINAFSMFDSNTLDQMTDLLDLTSNKAFMKLAKKYRKYEHVASYKVFLDMVMKFGKAPTVANEVTAEV